MDSQTQTIGKVLIANRGEIACRIIKTLRRMGIASVAIYSEADRGSLHVEMAAQAICVGAPPAAESYLVIDKVIKAALDSGADAIHPGYGFLAENPDFVDACEQAGIIFIGPDANAIRAMGLKDAAKKLMHDAGVPIVPGYHGANQNPDWLRREAEKIGYPILIKARAGGGGKGMRLVESGNDFATALAAARGESAASFADDRVLLEKYVVAPRHIEVQVFGDSHGNMVHLFERDCSLQRRYQKVIEEAPAPGMTAAMRAAMTTAAVQAARAVDYTNAGTVEFIVDAADGLRAERFYFMEMNTRLQVEHPVTEAITGVDLVEWQIQVASGKPLPKTQRQLKIRGAAMQARIYAEDADNDFMPTRGALTLFAIADLSRVDSGVRCGDSISPFYDPLIAKLIVHRDDRKSALIALAHALKDCHIAGCVTNIDFLGRLIRLPDFVSGNVSTALIQQNADALKKAQPAAAVLALAAARRCGMLTTATDPEPWRSLVLFRAWRQPVFEVAVTCQQQSFAIRVAIDSPNTATITIAQKQYALQILGHDQSRCQLSIDGISQHLRWCMVADDIAVFTGSQSFVLGYDAPLETAIDHDAATLQISAPMPGTITEIACNVGDLVNAGAVLVVLEAMKMQHSLTALADCEIDKINIAVGDQVAAGTALITFR